jgi:uncharacterized membrane protein YfcA
LVPGILAGGLAGAFLADAISNDALRGLFGVFVVVISLYIVVGKRPPAGGGLPGMPGHLLAGVLIGIVSALTGIGGGAVTNPFLIWRGVDMRNSVATSAACTLPVALAAPPVSSSPGWVWRDCRRAVPAISTGRRWQALPWAVQPWRHWVPGLRIPSTWKTFGAALHCY